jgi:hypothetical protein
MIDLVRDFWTTRTHDRTLRAVSLACLGMTAMVLAWGCTHGRIP